ncbi:MAG: CCA tRNA nucleotidyltransferase, partial [Sedimentisphaerales bacterium]|nr:CCA tRNA nucleotidyltransferase [Sedimentisphaerales bacterium]
MTNRQAAIEIVRQLHRRGFEALLAGGCVRDMLLGRCAKDYDVATNARPEEVMRLFRRTLKVGAKFGVVIVLTRGRQVEVATFRSEAGYEDGRHPGTVEFTSAAEDASRRDFTINGMFYDPLERRVIDYVDGQADLKRRIVRTIGDPQARLGEDYLRMLRAVRFSTQLEFEIESRTYAAIRRHAESIVRISGERIVAELEGILCHPNRAAGASLLSEMGLLAVIFPGLEAERADRA